MANKFIDSPKRAVQAAIFTEAQPADHGFSKEMELMKLQLEECNRLFHQMGMTAEDLAAVIHTGQGIHEAIRQKRNPTR